MSTPSQTTPTFTCPKCGMVSHNPNDLKEGYCGACHAYTAAYRIRDEEIDDSPPAKS